MACSRINAPLRGVEEKLSNVIIRTLLDFCRQGTYSSRMSWHLARRLAVAKNCETRLLAVAELTLSLFAGKTQLTSTRGK